MDAVVKNARFREVGPIETMPLQMGLEPFLSERIRSNRSHPDSFAGDKERRERTNHQCVVNFRTICDTWVWLVRSKQF